jgi:hypothetical protein
MRKVIQAAVRNGSFREGSRELAESAELDIDAKTLERAVHRIGGERLAERDAEVEAWKKLPLPKLQHGCPEGKVPPSLAVVQFDCGRMLVRERTVAAGESSVTTDVAQAAAEVATQTAAALAEEERACQAAVAAEEAKEVSVTEEMKETSPPGEPSVTSATETVPGDKNTLSDPCHSRFWRDSKVGVLLTMQSTEQDQDPCPQIPASFVDPQRMVKLVREMGHASVPAEKAAGKSAEQSDEASADSPRPGAPKPLVKSIVASRAPSHTFGAILAAAAWARGFAAAGRKAFLGDGAAMNWTLWGKFFSHYVPILDFIHALQYVFAAAMAGRPFNEGWQVYCRWIQAVWSGHVTEVIAELRARQAELGLPGVGLPTTDPRQVVATTLGYLETHQSRMDYARYRQLGLPIMTAYAESAVKQVSRRVKGTEKFWGEAGAEAILQLRADYLSDTTPLDAFWARREEHATGQRRYRPRSQHLSNKCAA